MKVCYPPNWRVTCRKDSGVKKRNVSTFVTSWRSGGSATLRRLRLRSLPPLKEWLSGRRLIQNATPKIWRGGEESSRPVILRDSRNTIMTGAGKLELSSKLKLWLNMGESANVQAAQLQSLSSLRSITSPEMETLIEGIYSRMGRVAATVSTFGSSVKAFLKTTFSFIVITVIVPRVSTATALMKGITYPLKLGKLFNKIYQVVNGLFTANQPVMRRFQWQA